MGNSITQKQKNRTKNKNIVKKCKYTQPNR